MTRPLYTSESGTPLRDGKTTSVPPVDASSYTRSEATRLLCAGAYSDAGFRDAAIAELIGSPERPVPPSLGYDLATVLRHCLRARSMNARSAILVLAVLAAGGLMALLGWAFDESQSQDPMLESTTSSSFMSLYVLTSMGLFVLAGLTSQARRALLSRSEPIADTNGKGATGAVRWIRQLFAVPLGLISLVLAVMSLLSPLVALNNGAILTAAAALTPPVLLLTIGAWHQLTLTRTLWTELTRRSFKGEAPKPSPSLFSARHAHTLTSIEREQFSRLVLYNEDNPFLGAGVPYRPWSLALELERSPEAPAAEPLDGRRVLDLIVPQLAKLAESSSRSSRDRLKDLELQECVFLPADLPKGVRRLSLPYEDSGVRDHLNEAAGEGAEQRRHFLRIRVPGWDEEVVTTVFVRVHTQGDLLILEVLPYVLPPLRPVFRKVDTLTEKSTRFRLPTLVSAPAMTVTTLTNGGRALWTWWLEWYESAGGQTSQAPQRSIRELGSRETRSMFQEMDVSRYVRTIQDRIASGTQQALTEAGYMTEEFQQQVVNISRGGVFVGGSMTGSIATGDGAKALTDTAPTAKGDKDKG